MKKLALTLAAAVLIITPLAFRSAPDLADEIQGAWRAVEFTNDEGETTRLARGGWQLFTEGHWASFRIGGGDGAGPREMLPEEPTDEQRLEAFRRYFATAGTYSVSGNELSTTLMMHRNPNTMAEGATRTGTVEIDGDTMVRTFINAETGARFVVKYMRQ